jgi:hypothetical protein
MPTWKDWLFANAVVKDDGECLVRSFHEQLASGEGIGGRPMTTRSMMVQAAIEVAFERIMKDAKSLRIVRKIKTAFRRYSKGQADAWMKSEEDIPDDVHDAMSEAWDRRVELTADVLREVGEAGLADAILSDPEALWKWHSQASAIGWKEIDAKDMNLDAAVADLDKRYQAAWADYFPKAKTTGLDK